MKRSVGAKNKSAAKSILNLWQREVGDLAPKSFSNLARASEDLVLRLGITKKLKKHRGCVNALSFSTDGDILVSGSDDRMVIMWNWEAGLVKSSFHSGHHGNVFQARFMPYTDDQTMITCAADGEVYAVPARFSQPIPFFAVSLFIIQPQVVFLSQQCQVRRAQLMEDGSVATKMLAKHAGPAHKIAIEPGSPFNFYSCGEDGAVMHFDLRKKHAAKKLFVCRCLEDVANNDPIVRLRAIAIDPRDPNVFAVAGGDENVRIYDVRKYTPNSGCPTCHFSPPDDGTGEVTGLAFSDASELLVSYFGDSIHLFLRDQLADNYISRKVYKGHTNMETVKGVSFLGPNCEYVASGSDCGRVFIWRKHDGVLLRAMEGDKSVVNCIEPHPFSSMIATSGIESNIKIWTPNLTEPASPVNLDEVAEAGIANWIAFDDSDTDDDIFWVADNFADDEFDTDMYSDDEDDDGDDDDDDDGDDDSVDDEDDKSIYDDDADCSDDQEDNNDGGDNGGGNYDNDNL